MSACEDHQESLLSSEPSKALQAGVPRPAMELPTAPPAATVPFAWTLGPCPGRQEGQRATRHG